MRNKVRSSLTSLTPHENIYNLPNFLTVTRLFAAPATAYLLLHDHHTWALGLFAYAGITDLVDGWMARKWKLQTVAGSVMDPMADKALMIILTVTLAVKGAIPCKETAKPSPRPPVHPQHFTFRLVRGQGLDEKSHTDMQTIHEC